MNRRYFIKSISATAILSSMGISCAQEPRHEVLVAIEGLRGAYQFAVQNLGVEESFRCTIGDIGRWDHSIRFADDLKTRIPDFVTFDNQGRTMYRQNPDHVR